MRLKNSLRDKFPHYWMCGQCAKDKGGVWPEGHVCTMVYDTCKYCDIPGPLAPWVDYNWPKDRESEVAAHEMRD